MVKVSRLNGESIFINPDQIRVIESMSETVITFMDGHKLIVKESPSDLKQAIIKYKKECQN